MLHPARTKLLSRNAVSILTIVSRRQAPTQEIPEAGELWHERSPSRRSSTLTFFLQFEGGKPVVELLVLEGSKPSLELLALKRNLHRLDHWDGHGGYQDEQHCEATNAN